MIHRSWKTQCLVKKKEKEPQSNKDNRFYVGHKSKNFKDNKTPKNIGSNSICCR